MPDGHSRVYLDTCVFLDYINDHPDRASTIEAVLAEGRRIGVRLYTSILTTVEVAFGALEQRQAALDQEVEERIEKLWLPGSAVELIEYYRLIGDDARGLMRQAITRGWSLKAMDAIHLSTARRVEAQEFFTYEPRLAG